MESTVRRSAAGWQGPRQRRRLLRGAAIVTVAVLALVWVLLGSPWLRVTTVDVVGAEAAQQGPVRSIVDQQVGQPLLRVDSVAVQREVEKVSTVSRVDVTREWPNRLRVVVTPRTPMMAVEKSQGVLELVDANGVSYARVDTLPAGLPKATLAHPDQGAEATAGAAALSALDAGQRARVKSLSVASPDDVRFVIDDVTVLWGGASAGRQKAVTLAALLQQKGVRTINVSAPDSPVAS